MVREWEPQVAEIVDLTVAKIKRDLLETGVADVMKWWKFMTADVLGLIAFGESFNMVEKEQVSVHTWNQLGLTRSRNHKSSKTLKLFSSPLV